MTHILSITGSDNSGYSGLQLDHRIISEMGAHALTSATSIVLQDETHIIESYDLPTSIIASQVANMVSTFFPKAVKVGLLHNAESVMAVADEIVGCRHIVAAPGIMTSKGESMVDDVTVRAICQRLIPISSLLMLRCVEAERILGIDIKTDDDMLKAARLFVEMGTDYVMLRGAQIDNGRLTALLASSDSQQFFSSYNIEGWQQHGVGGALAAAIATRLGMGDTMDQAIAHAHEFIHSRIVYSVDSEGRACRSADLYNAFMHLLPSHYQHAHDVAYYADKLHISARYLSSITSATVGKSPKQVIYDYLMQEARQMLSNSHLSVKEIASRLGFSSVAGFCKFFRIQAQVSPSEYRKSEQ